MVDSFEAGKELRDKCKRLAATVMDKKMKKRFHTMLAVSEKVWQMKCLKLVTPNETRVGGCYNMFVSILRSKPLLQIMSNNARNYPSSEVYRKVCLTMTEYDRVAQFESVLRTTKLVSLQTQQVCSLIDCFFRSSLFDVSKNLLTHLIF